MRLAEIRRFDVGRLGREQGRRQCRRRFSQSASGAGGGSENRIEHDFIELAEASAHEDDTGASTRSHLRLAQLRESQAQVVLDGGIAADFSQGQRHVLLGQGLVEGVFFNPHDGGLERRPEPVAVGQTQQQLSRSRLAKDMQQFLAQDEGAPGGLGRELVEVRAEHGVIHGQIATGFVHVLVGAPFSELIQPQHHGGVSHSSRGGLLRLGRVSGLEGLRCRGLAHTVFRKFSLSLSARRRTNDVGYGPDTELCRGSAMSEKGA